MPVEVFCIRDIFEKGVRAMSSEVNDRYRRILAACRIECGLEVSDNRYLCYKCPINNEMFTVGQIYEEKEMPRLCPLRNDDDKWESYKSPAGLDKKTQRTCISSNPGQATLFSC